MNLSRAQTLKYSIILGAARKLHIGRSYHRKTSVRNRYIIIFTVITIQNHLLFLVSPLSQQSLNLHTIDKKRISFQMKCYKRRTFNRKMKRWKICIQNETERRKNLHNYVFGSYFFLCFMAWKEERKKKESKSLFFIFLIILILCLQCKMGILFNGNHKG